jgi:hypothetical protein
MQALSQLSYTPEKEMRILKTLPRVVNAFCEIS